MPPSATLRDFADYVREKAFNMDTNRLVKLQSMPQLGKPVYCKVMFTDNNSVKPKKLADGNKSVAFVLGPESSEDIVERPLWRWLMRAGLSPETLQKHKKEKHQAWLLLFQTPPDVYVQAAHWEGVIDYVRHYYPEVYMAVYTHAFRVRQQPVDSFEKELGFRFEISLNDPNLFMSAKKLKSLYPDEHLPPSVADTRLFLYCQIGLDEKFYGDGFTRQWDHSRGAKQYIMPNLDSNGSTFELIPFSYDIPLYFD